MFQNLITGRLEGKRVGRYAIIRNNNSVSLSQFDINKINFLPLIGLCRPKRFSIVLGEVFRIGFNHLNNRRLLLTPGPSLISERSNLLSRFTFHTLLKSKIAFTLAEVLITLGIIGVVAALTMPSLIQNYRKSVVEKKIYASYNILQNMIRLSALDNGDPLYWELENWDHDIFEKYFAPYLKIVQKCKQQTDDELYCDSSVKSLNGTNHGSYSYKYILNNGVGIFFRPGGTIGSTRRRGTFIVDILTGPRERIMGRNVFAFNLIVDNDRYYITGSQDYSNTVNFCTEIKNNRNSVINDCKNGTTSAGYTYGIHCTALIECNNWKIPEDYPTHF